MNLLYNRGINLVRAFHERGAKRELEADGEGGEHSLF